jgi:hypothetical protein
MIEPSQLYTRGLQAAKIAIAESTNSIEAGGVPGSYRMEGPPRRAIPGNGHDPLAASRVPRK